MAEATRRELMVPRRIVQLDLSLDEASTVAAILGHVGHDFGPDERPEPFVHAASVLDALESAGISGWHNSVASRVLDVGREMQTLMFRRAAFMGLAADER